MAPAQVCIITALLPVIFCQFYSAAVPRATVEEAVNKVSLTLTRLVLLVFLYLQKRMRKDQEKHKPQVAATVIGEKRPAVAATRAPLCELFAHF